MTQIHELLAKKSTSRSRGLKSGAACAFLVILPETKLSITVVLLGRYDGGELLLQGLVHEPVRGKPIRSNLEARFYHFISLLDNFKLNSTGSCLWVSSL